MVIDHAVVPLLMKEAKERASSGKILELMCRIRKEGFSMLILATQFQFMWKLTKYTCMGFRGIKGLRGNLGAGHWNEKGHRLAGDIISEHICKTIF